MNDEAYIKLTLEIAKKGIGHVSPNPLVGCLIVKNNKIISAGYHEKFGHNHAEVNAIKKANCDLSDSTLYVNLEPCSHYGKTPPCTELIIENKIKRVVVGTLDVNPLVSGKGVQELIENGIEVKVGVLEKECMDLNRFFFKYITKKLPYITLKTAQTLDGKIADIHLNSKWITSKESRTYVHKLRTKYDAVLVGSGTVKKDNPSLTVRLTEGRNPKRVIIDTNLCLITSHKIFTTEKNVYVITSDTAKSKKRKINMLNKLGVKIIFTEMIKGNFLNLKAALGILAKDGISSLLVEGGSKVFTSFVRENLFDEIRMFISPKLIGEGLPVLGNIGFHDIRKAVKLDINGLERIGDDIVIDLRK